MQRRIFVFGPLFVMSTLCGCGGGHPGSPSSTSASGAGGGVSSGGTASGNGGHSASGGATAGSGGKSSSGTGGASATGGAGASSSAGSGAAAGSSAEDGIKLSVAIGYSNMYVPADGSACKQLSFALPDGSTTTRSQSSIAPGTTGDGCNWPMVLEAELNPGETATEVLVDSAVGGGNTNVWYAGGDHSNSTYQQMLGLYADARSNIEALGLTVVPGCAYIDFTYYIGPDAQPVTDPTTAGGVAAIQYDADISATLMGWLSEDLGLSCFRAASHTWGGLGSNLCTYGDPDCVSTQVRNETFVLEELMMRQVPGLSWPVDSTAFSHGLWPSGFADDGGHMQPQTVEDVAVNYARALSGAAPTPPSVSIQPGSFARSMNFQVDTSAAGGNVDFIDWYFGPDELRASGESALHTFAAAGSYDVQVFVHMNNAAGGAVSQASVTVSVP